MKNITKEELKDLMFGMSITKCGIVEIAETVYNPKLELHKNEEDCRKIWIE